MTQFLEVKNVAMRESRLMPRPCQVSMFMRGMRSVHVFIKALMIVEVTWNKAFGEPILII